MNPEIQTAHQCSILKRAPPMDVLRVDTGRVMMKQRANDVGWIIVIFCSWSVNGQNSINYENACCGRSIMESNGLVVIETERVLPRGNFTALVAKFCSPDVVWIQLWRRNNLGTNYGLIQMELRWQIQYTPGATSSSSSNSATQIVSFDNPPLAIEDSDRLGIFTPMSTNHTASYPVPYDTDPDFTFYFSRDHVELTNDVTAGFRITMDDLRWPRSFRNYLAFCESKTNCPRLGSDEEEPFYTTTVKTSGTTEPTCCADCATREQMTELTKTIDNQTKTIQVLQDTINIIISLLKNYAAANVSTGTCPPGFVAGPPGVPYCYVVYRLQIQMGEAVLRCSDDHQAFLINIRSEAEQNFLRNLASSFSNYSSQSVEKYWTTGMFNFNTRTWVWYEESWRTKSSFTYRKWYNDVEPVPVNDNDVCMTLAYDRSTSSAYWLKTPCFSLAYFICQVPKTCS